MENVVNENETQDKKEIHKKRTNYVISCARAIKEKDLVLDLVYKPDRKIVCLQVEKAARLISLDFYSRFGVDYKVSGYCRVFAYILAHMLKFYYKMDAGLIISNPEHYLVYFKAEGKYYSIDSYLNCIEISNFEFYRDEDLYRFSNYGFDDSIFTDFEKEMFLDYIDETRVPKDYSELWNDYLVNHLINFDRP